MMCIRAEMGKDSVLLQGIVEADETYIGGKKVVKTMIKNMMMVSTPNVGVAQQKMLFLVLLSEVERLSLNSQKTSKQKQSPSSSRSL